MQVADIQRFCTHDGPGVRTTIFLKGCPLRCAWCHNPETQSLKPELMFYKNKCIGCGACLCCKQGVHSFDNGHTAMRERCIGCGDCVALCPTKALELVGKPYTVQELYAQIAKDSVFYGETGGVTLSGGEPLIQADEAVALLQLCRENGLHTAVETCGFVDPEVIRRAVPVTDLFLWDVKDTDVSRHKQYTGVSNERILQNLLLADSLGAKTRIRCILVNGVNADAAHYENIATLVMQLSQCEGVEFIPYHSYGGAKTLALRGESDANDAWIPTPKQIAEAKTALRQRGVSVF